MDSATEELVSMLREDLERIELRQETLAKLVALDEFSPTSRHHRWLWRRYKKAVDESAHCLRALIDHYSAT